MCLKMQMQDGSVGIICGGHAPPALVLKGGILTGPDSFPTEAAFPALTLEHEVDPPGIFLPTR
jgi:hypothetical protein